MQKNLGIVVGVVVVVLLIAVVWMFRGRPAGEVPSETDTARDVISEEESTVPSPAAYPVSGETGVPGTMTPGEESTGTVGAGTAVSITATGFSPATVTVMQGDPVTFTNDDQAPHQVASTPHPAHTDYPALNGESMATGQSRTVTFTKVGTFGYHDHLNPGLQGTVIVGGKIAPE